MTMTPTERVIARDYLDSKRYGGDQASTGWHQERMSRSTGHTGQSLKFCALVCVGSVGASVLGVPGFLALVCGIILACVALRKG